MLERLAALAQALTYVGTTLAAGGAFARESLRPEAHAARTLRRVTRIGAVVTIAGTVFALVVLVLRLGEGLDATILGAVLGSNVGGAAALRLTGACLLLFVPGDDEGVFNRGMQSLAAVLAVGSFAFSGHAAAEGLWPGIIAAVHVALVAWWIGALLALRQAGRTAELRALLRRFSALALWMIGALATAGTLLVAILIDVAAGLTPYARNLAVKLAIVAIVLGVAAYNRFALTKAIEAGDATAAAKLARTIDAELVLIGAILIATAIMTTYSSPHG
jgi:putative copper export protein